MEASDCVYGGYCRAGAPQEKKAAGDHFIVEDLLDFSNKEEGESGDAEGEAEAEAEGGGAGNSAESASTVTAVDSCNSSLSSGDRPHFSPVAGAAGLSGDLCEPLQHDELAELEWLSHFVEDSFSSDEIQKLQLISGIKSGSGSVGSNCSSSDTRGSEAIPCSYSPVAGKLAVATASSPPPAPVFLPEAATVPGKARSKRSRAAPNSWSSRLLVLSPTPHSASSSDDSDSILLDPYPYPSPSPSPSLSPVKKNPKPTKKKEPGSAALASASDGRKCLHCATDKTPQWRTGPLGPKTLCNACGVRYKSGRLVPEYRPAASPTFVLSKHSNSHRKVLELRRQKEMQQQQPPFLHAGAAAGYDTGTTGPGDDFLIHHRLGPDFRQLI